MTTVALDFQKKAHRIPFLGLGLSVDVYSPNLLDLSREWKSRGLGIGYLEIFKANPLALKIVRAQLPDIPMAYHAEGLWFTQPDWPSRYDACSRMKLAAHESALLDAWWLNQECASKEITGFAFGTYVPPLFTKESAFLTASQIGEAQRWLDQNWAGNVVTPLILLEVPPLTYFGIGELSFAQFFRIVADLAPCGFVLDIGHVWTAWRYGGAWGTQSLEEYFEIFLEEFPLERVIQIHVAGLECHGQTQGGEKVPREPLFPAWIDTHAAPIPTLLFSLLEKVLANPRLTNLKGLALEVDTKDIALICQEWQRVQEEFGNVLGSFRTQNNGVSVPELLKDPPRAFHDCSHSYLSIRQKLSQHYREYVSLITGQNPEEALRSLGISPEVYHGVSLYSNRYLPCEILKWGGEIDTMFPESCRALEERGIDLVGFVRFWFEQPQTGQKSGYDFFVIKVLTFVSFLKRVLPEFELTVQQEARGLLEGYDLACSALEYS